MMKPYTNQEGACTHHRFSGFLLFFLVFSAHSTVFSHTIKPIKAAHSPSAPKQHAPKPVQQQAVGVSYTAGTGYFPLVHQQQAAKIYTDTADAAVVGIAAKALQSDIQLLSGKRAELAQHGDQLTAYPVIIGTIGHSVWIDRLIKDKKLSAAKVKGKWETFSIAVVANPAKNVKQALVIYGNDPRGTAFGVFELSRKIGISPLVWWADVKPAHHPEVYLTPGQSIDGPPSVKYRGVFLNDEDWGLRPWAAKSMDTDKKDIGPKTYAKVFELLLRLKANYLWPAMHPGTKAFWYYPENPALARQYAIVMGSSHHEPMLRDTEFEWNENFKAEYGKDHGPWQYDVNRDEIYRFFDDRVKQSKNNDAYYTVGMRSTGDGEMHGPATMEGKVKLLEEVIRDQREIITNQLAKPASEVPQVFCPYKEVLPIYRAGLSLPEDITITWVDDNHGYIRQLPNPKEQKRAGGNGVYYHLSYWGTPQDYLWLCSTSPALISLEMSKAYHYQANRMWVFNVGDLKPAEMETQFALDLAWNVNKWTPEKAGLYAEEWAAETFGKPYAKRIAAIKSVYYQLAAAGKPEHIDRVDYTAPEVENRLKDYAAIALQAEALAKEIPAPLQDAFFELILYPVKGAKLMNEKMLYLSRSAAVKGKSSKQARVYLDKATAAYKEIQVITQKYNEVIAGGKWNGMMDAHPRNRPMFDAPEALAKTRKESTTNDTDPQHRSGTADGHQQPVSVIAAAAYVHPSAVKGGAIKTIEGLGIGGKSITVLPPLNRSFTEKDITEAPYVDYQIKVVKGKNSIRVKCLPVFRVYDGFSMRYGISVDQQPVQITDLTSLAETLPWEKNVLQGYTEGDTIYQSDKSGEVTLRIYLLDPGLVISQIEVAAR